MFSSFAVSVIHLRTGAGVIKPLPDASATVILGPFPSFRGDCLLSMPGWSPAMETSLTIAMLGSKPKADVRAPKEIEKEDYGITGSGSVHSGL